MSKMGVEPDDATLIARYRAGDANALNELVEKYRRPLYGYIHKMTAGSSEADDVFQETWFRAIRGMARYRQKHLLGWLTHIARNLVIDRYRRRGPDVSLDAENTRTGETLLDRVVDPAPQPAATAVGADVVDRVTAAVAGLPREQKEVFVLRTELELTFKAIARIQGVSINTALARMQYALAKLRPLLARDYEEWTGHRSGQ